MKDLFYPDVPRVLVVVYVTNFQGPHSMLAPNDCWSALVIRAGGGLLHSSNAFVRRACERGPRPSDSFRPGSSQTAFGTPRCCTKPTALASENAREAIRQPS